MLTHANIKVYSILLCAYWALVIQTVVKYMIYTDGLNLTASIADRRVKFLCML